MVHETLTRASLLQRGSSKKCVADLVLCQALGTHTWWKQTMSLKLDTTCKMRVLAACVCVRVLSL